MAMTMETYPSFTSKISTINENMFILTRNSFAEDEGIPEAGWHLSMLRTAL